VPRANAHLRKSHAELIAARRAAERDIGVALSAALERINWRRRRHCEQEPELFCRTYFPQIFYQPFTDDQRTMIDAIVDRCRHGGYQAIAATRGEGKTSITRVVGGVWAVVYGQVRWLTILGANMTEAGGALEDIKYMYETSDTLGQDFPEVCLPIRELAGQAQRGKSQTINQVRTRLKWEKTEIRFGEVEGLPAAAGICRCARTIVTIRGVDSAIRGLVRQGVRPDLIICDDIQTRDSARSTTETKARIETLTKDVLGLAGPGEQMAVVYLGTIIRQGCITEQFTNRKEKPAWNGLRHRFMVTPPDQEDMWHRYIEIRQRDQLNNDRFGRTAHQYYLDHRPAMDTGAAMNNPYRFDGKPIPAAETKKRPRPRDLREISALQHAWNIIADRGQDHFDSEFQNEPKSEAPESTGLEPSAVQRKLAGTPRGVAPAGTQYITGHIDVHGRALYWVFVAWLPGRVGVVIDYGTEPVHSPIAGALVSDENIEHTQRAIFTALVSLRDWEHNHGWPRADTGEVIHLGMGLIDTGWMPEPVGLFIKATTGNIWRAAKGYGSGHKQTYRRPTTIRRGQGAQHWWRKRQSDGMMMFHIDADHYKNAVHQGFLTPEKMPGSLAIFGDDPIVHRTFAAHITAEQWQREFIVGKGWREGFLVRSRHNHWLDNLANAAAAADILGLTVMAPAAEAKPLRLSDLQRRKRLKVTS